MSTVLQETPKTIEFRPISWRDKPLYDRYFPDAEGRGCEFSFANLYLWGRQNLCEIHGHIVLFSHFDRKSVYPYPVGQGDKRAVLDAIIADVSPMDVTVFPSPAGVGVIAVTMTSFPSSLSLNLSRTWRGTLAMYFPYVEMSSSERPTFAATSLMFRTSASAAISSSVFM